LHVHIYKRKDVLCNFHANITKIMEKFQEFYQKDEFLRNGNLRTSCIFSFYGEIYRKRLRTVETFSQATEMFKKTGYAIDLEDQWGFRLCYFNNRISGERALEILDRIPTGQTIRIEGNVAVRKGHIYFDAKHFTYPDGDPVIILRTPEDPTESEETEKCLDKNPAPC